LVLIGTDLPGLEWRDTCRAAFTALRAGTRCAGACPDGVTVDRNATFIPLCSAAFRWGVDMAVRHQTWKVLQAWPWRRPCLPLAADSIVRGSGPWQGDRLKPAVQGELHRRRKPSVDRGSAANPAAGKEARVTSGSSERVTPAPTSCCRQPCFEHKSISSLLSPAPG